IARASHSAPVSSSSVIGVRSQATRLGGTRPSSSRACRISSRRVFRPAKVQSPHARARVGTGFVLTVSTESSASRAIMAREYTARRMTLVDIGANLTHASFREDLDAVLVRARANGVGTIVVTGTSVQESRRAVELAEAYPRVLYATAGVHPHHARDCNDGTIPALRALASHPSVVALGECGLDFNRNYSPHPDQEKWFEAQLDLAAEIGKRLFLHSRDAHPRLPGVRAARRA